MFAALIFDRDPLRLARPAGGAPRSGSRPPAASPRSGLLLWFALRPAAPAQAGPRRRCPAGSASSVRRRVPSASRRRLRRLLHRRARRGAGRRSPRPHGRPRRRRPGETAPPCVRAARLAGRLAPSSRSACRSSSASSRLRCRRIFALAKLSFKEAIRRRVLYAFTGLLLVFLFGSWFVPSSSPRTRSAPTSRSSSSR